jgi:hypothetical protein
MRICMSIVYEHIVYEYIVNEHSAWAQCMSTVHEYSV